MRQKPDITAADGVSTSLTTSTRSSARRRRRRTRRPSRRSCCPATRATSRRPARGVRRHGARPGPGRRRRAHRHGHRARRQRARLHRRDAAAAGRGLGAHRDAGHRRRRRVPRAGRSGDARVPAKNVGDGTATGVSVRVTTGDAGARSRPRAQSSATIAAGEERPRTSGSRCRQLPARQAAARSACGTTFAGGLSPTYDHAAGPHRAAGATARRVHVHRPARRRSLTTTEAGASVTIPVAGVGYPSQVTFSVDGTTCTAEPGATTVGIDHTFIAIWSAR